MIRKMTTDEYNNVSKVNVSEEEKVIHKGEMRFFKTVGICLYILSFILNIWLHVIVLKYALVRVEAMSSVLFWLFYIWSFIAFTHATVFAVDFIFSVLPPVVSILNGKKKINNDAYMNTLWLDYDKDSLPDVTISIPVYMEENGVIFETVYRSKLAAEDYEKQTGKECNVIVSDDGIGVLLKNVGTIESLEEKIEEYSRCGSVAGLEVGSDAYRVIERVYFYRKTGVSFVVRPPFNRPGIFKKSSNLNYTLRIGRKVDEGNKISGLVGEGAEFEGGHAEGNIHTNSIILLIDKDSGLHPEIISAIVPEFTRDDKLAYVQCATKASNMEENYFARLSGRQVNNNNHNVFPCMALKGIFVPLVGHNVFIRRSALANLGYWHEHRVSEDFDLAIRLYARGWHGKYAQVQGLEFTEYASRTYSEDAMKEYRYTYGLIEMFLSGTMEWGKTRWYDTFYMIIYFIARINNALLLPYIVIITLTGMLDLMFLGYALCCVVFIILPSLRTILLARKIKKEYLFRISESFMMFFTFSGCTFPAGAGAVKYFLNVITKKEHAFPATSVSTLVYSFKEGLRFIYKYFLKNKGVLVVFAFCVERIHHILLYSSRVGAAEAACISELFLIAFAPFFMTPQLFQRKKGGILIRRESDNMLKCFNASIFFREARKFVDENVDKHLFLYAVEIDNFHVLNLWYGHDVGEEYADRIGDKLAYIIDKYGGVPGHISGGNFICVVPNGDALLNQIQTEMSDYVKTDPKFMGFFPLISVYEINDTTLAIEKMYDRALLALDGLRGKLKERSVHYNADMDKKLDAEVKMLRDVHRGIDSDEFTFFVQPRCDIDTGKIVGGEALVRWKHRERGFVSPGEFIPVLEKSGLTLIVDQIIWEKVIAWQGKRIKDGNECIPVSINITRADLFSIDVKKTLEDLCEKYKVPYKLVMIEISDKTYNDVDKEILAMIDELSKAGFPLVIDGFGSGYSSMIMLKSVKPDIITFNLRVLNDQEGHISKAAVILQTVANCVDVLDVPLVVKTVETNEHDECLKKYGCKYGQGFFYHKPMEVSELEKLMRVSENVDYGGIKSKMAETVDVARELEIISSDKSSRVTGVFLKKDDAISVEKLDDRLGRVVGDCSEVSCENFVGVEEIFEDAELEPENYAMGMIKVKSTAGNMIPFLMRAIYIAENGGTNKYFCDFTDMRRYKRRNVGVE
ncbi:EAL domain-containing protein [Butyrivibrio sp. M55]|uniref:EAL domain-containing protein n=1 Tax=Butyrivibrio sp. M55 TaxID=1855323 RepID=UPI0008E07948|nr:EAL domain-containing protein [Butyrivibrio sp. M55]SFU83198.1 EAL domain, c-di-GMP-specific phosphodiesterase class I (or its enzymatically inactive variant) [Butyrivibrio sp. M55]